MLTAELLAERCAADGQFLLASRYWNGGLRLEMGDRSIGLRMTAGSPLAADPGATPGVVGLSGPVELWEGLLAAEPSRLVSDVSSALSKGLRRYGDDLAFWQYYPAIQRVIELLRPEVVSQPASEPGHRPRFDSPVGRYLHIDLDGKDHRIYIEEAGQGIPLLLQHTAGSHGIQWRHLFECREITDHFRLIAYDLPFHGKSIPPIGACWWEEQYQLSAARLRSIPVTISKCLDLDRPAFMGCSVGGLLALDLALLHPKEFRAVISLEGTLKITGRLESLIGLWHPQVSDETKARMMEGMMAPTSPLAYRKETIHSYSAGWSPLFVGDLHYYYDDFDLTDRASDIDTSKVAVHILSGEYDYSAPQEQAQAAHEAIAGSTYQPMDKLGHFPMSEDPQRFLGYLLPILKSVRETSA
jgi:pimeloyl-ACP methyl ester carboxylesterase